MKELYDKIYSNPLQYENYGHSNHGKPWIDVILENSNKTIASWLDVGCGYNELIKEIREKDIIKDSWGIDFSCPGADQDCDILDLPFPDKCWDYVTAFGVMEHLLPHQVPHALIELSRVSYRFAFIVSFEEAIMVVDGENAHPTVWSQVRWREEIEKAGGIMLEIPGPMAEFFIGEWT